MLHRLPPGCCNFSIHCWNLDIRSPNTEIRYMHDSHACHGNWGNCVVLLFVPSCCCDWSWCTCMHHNCKTIHCCQKSICILSGNSAHCVYMCYGIENRVFHFYMIILCSSIGWGMLLTRYKTLHEENNINSLHGLSFVYIQALHMRITLKHVQALHWLPGVSFNYWTHNNCYTLWTHACTNLYLPNCVYSNYYVLKLSRL